MKAMDPEPGSVKKNFFSGMNRPVFSILISLAILTSAGIITYINTLNNEFILDDFLNITNNKYIQADNITFEFLKNLKKCPNPNRPVSYLSFALNYYFSGYSLPAFHLTNICIHIICGLLLFWLCLQIFTMLPPYKNHPILLSLFAALVWIVHPLNIQSVTYLVQRMNSLGAMFYLLSVNCYFYLRKSLFAAKTTHIKGSKLYAGLWVALAVISGFLALGSKENTITLPAMILLCEWIFFQDGRLPGPKTILILSASLIALCLTAAFLFMKPDPITWLNSLYQDQPFTMIQRIMTEWRVLIYYLSLFLFPAPSRLALEYDYPISKSLIAPPTTIISLLAIVALLLFAFYSRRKHRLWAFAIFWFFIALSVESSFVGLAIIFEHRTYLPIMLLCAATTGEIFLLVRKPVPLIAIFSLLVIVFIHWSCQRNATWRDPITLYEDNLKKTPSLPRLITNLGEAYAAKGNLIKAQQLYKRSLELFPSDPKTNLNMGLLQLDLKNYKGALVYFRKSLLRKKELDPDIIAGIYCNMGICYGNTGNISKAEKYFRLAHKQPNTSDEAVAKIFNMIGAFYANRFNQAKAEYYYKKALSRSPDYGNALFNLAMIYLQKGDYGKALEHLRHAAKSMPDNPYVHYYAGIALARTGNTTGAKAEIRKAIHLKPDFSQALNFLQKLK